MGMGMGVHIVMELASVELVILSWYIRVYRYIIARIAIDYREIRDPSLEKSSPSPLFVRPISFWIR